MVHDLVEWSEPQRLRVLLDATCAISTNNERTKCYVKFILCYTLELSNCTSFKEFGMPYSLKKGPKL